MSECNKCNGSLFVCENHPNQEAHQCKHCKGAGMPCECTEPVSGWISVKDRLPKHNEEILGFEKLIFFGWYDNKFGFLDVVEECHRGQTTHWMPLPNPPKEVIK